VGFATESSDGRLVHLTVQRAVVCVSITFIVLPERAGTTYLPSGVNSRIVDGPVSDSLAFSSEPVQSRNAAGAWAIRHRVSAIGSQLMLLGWLAIRLIPLKVFPSAKSSCSEPLTECKFCCVRATATRVHFDSLISPTTLFVRDRDVDCCPGAVDWIIGLSSRAFKDNVTEGSQLNVETPAKTLLVHHGRHSSSQYRLKSRWFSGHYFDFLQKPMLQGYHSGSFGELKCLLHVKKSPPAFRQG